MSYAYKQLVCHESGACIIIGTNQKEGPELIMILLLREPVRGSHGDTVKAKDDS